MLGGERDVERSHCDPRVLRVGVGPRLEHLLERDQEAPVAEGVALVRDGVDRRPRTTRPCTTEPTASLRGAVVGRGGRRGPTVCAGDLAVEERQRLHIGHGMGRRAAPVLDDALLVRRRPSHEPTHRRDSERPSGDARQRRPGDLHGSGAGLPGHDDRDRVGARRSTTRGLGRVGGGPRRGDQRGRQMLARPARRDRTETGLHGSCHRTCRGLRRAMSGSGLRMRITLM